MPKDSTNRVKKSIQQSNHYTPLEMECVWLTFVFLTPLSWFATLSESLIRTDKQSSQRVAPSTPTTLIRQQHQLANSATPISNNSSFASATPDVSPIPSSLNSSLSTAATTTTSSNNNNVNNNNLNKQLLSLTNENRDLRFESSFLFGMLWYCV
jgi:hypothetical protein